MSRIQFLRRQPEDGLLGDAEEGGDGGEDEDGEAGEDVDGEESFSEVGRQAFKLYFISRLAIGRHSMAGR